MPPVSATAKPSAPPGWPGRIFLIGMALAVGGFTIHILTALWPFLAAESSRSPWWLAILMWSGDALASYWFFQFCVSHLLGLQRSARTGWRRNWVVVLTLFGSMILDVGISGLTAAQEKRGYARRQEVPGEIIAVRRTTPRDDDPEPFYAFSMYVYTYRFADAHGRTFTGISHLHVGGPDDIEPKLAPAVTAAIQARQTPFPITVAYDPERPQRSWVAGTDWVGDSRNLWGYSLMVTLLQLPFLLGVMVIDRAVLEVARREAWWRDLYKVVPLLLELFLLYGFCLPLA